MSKVYDVITERILEKLEAGVVPWHKPWKTAGGESPKNLVSQREYHGINVFMLACQDYASPYWLTFKQAKALGGSVRKGEHGTPVVFWKRLERKDEEESADEKKERSPFMLLYSTVFNLEQTDGVKVPKGRIEEVDDEEAEAVSPIEACEAIVKAMPQRPEIKHGGNRAYYRPTTDQVHLPERDSFESAEAYHSTQFHELVHATGHESRLARAGVVDAIMYGDTNYSREELVAEMGAAFLCGEVGIEQKTLDSSASYISGWLKALKNDRTLVVLAAAQASKAARFIMGDVPQVQTEGAAA